MDISTPDNVVNIYESGSLAILQNASEMACHGGPILEYNALMNMMQEAKK